MGERQILPSGADVSPFWFALHRCLLIREDLEVVIKTGSFQMSACVPARDKIKTTTISYSVQGNGRRGRERT